MSKRSRWLVAFVAVLSMILFGAESCDDPNQKGAQKTGQQQTEEAFAQQQAAVPYPKEQLKGSLERANLRERLLRTNKPNAIGYVYLLNFGKVLGYYTVKGKVSSTQSQMTTDTLIEYGCDDGVSGCGVVTVNAPGDDGSYGPNEDGIFFFTSEGAFVTTNLEYIWADQPLPFNVPELNGTR